MLTSLLKIKQNSPHQLSKTYLNTLTTFPQNPEIPDFMTINMIFRCNTLVLIMLLYGKCILESFATKMCVMKIAALWMWCLLLPRKLDSNRCVRWKFARSQKRLNQDDTSSEEIYHGSYIWHKVKETWKPLKHEYSFGYVFI